MAELYWKSIRDLLDYDPISGVLTWKKRDRALFSSDNACNAWNARFANQTAGSIKQDGYLHVRIFGKSCLGHRLIWAWTTGRWPQECIDHINHDRVDNRWENLRSVAVWENSRNMSISKLNKSGVNGVTWKGNKWRAQIRADGRVIYLGSFDEKDEAAAARKLAEIKYGYHPNHGATAASVARRAGGYSE